MIPRPLGLDEPMQEHHHPARRGRGRGGVRRRERLAVKTDPTVVQTHRHCRRDRATRELACSPNAPFAPPTARCTTPDSTTVVTGRDTPTTRATDPAMVPPALTPDPHRVINQSTERIVHPRRQRALHPSTMLTTPLTTSITGSTPESDALPTSDDFFGDTTYLFPVKRPDRRARVRRTGCTQCCRLRSPRHPSGWDSPIPGRVGSYPRTSGPRGVA